VLPAGERRDVSRWDGGAERLGNYETYRWR
jgi:hypothetical protein